MLIIFSVIALIFSVMIHEVSHGFMAEKLGDPTARLAGRLTLNPIKHIDILGSLILPGIMILTGSPIVFGWAKPVPYDPRNLKNPKTDAAKIAAAGPLSNFFLAFVFGLAIRFSVGYGLSPDSTLITLFAIIVFTNIYLGFFNLVPIAPMDGSKILAMLLPRKPWAYQLMDVLERNGFFIIIILLLLGFFSFLGPIAGAFFSLITGFGL